MLLWGENPELLPEFESGNLKLQSLLVNLNYSLLNNLITYRLKFKSYEWPDQIKPVSDLLAHEVWQDDHQGVADAAYHHVWPGNTKLNVITFILVTN